MPVLGHVSQFLRFDVELWQHIFRHCGYLTILRLRLVSTHFNKLVESASVLYLHPRGSPKLIEAKVREVFNSNSLKGINLSKIPSSLIYPSIKSFYCANILSLQMNSDLDSYLDKLPHPLSSLTISNTPTKELPFMAISITYLSMSTITYLSLSHVHLPVNFTALLPHTLLELRLDTCYLDCSLDKLPPSIRSLRIYNTTINPTIFSSKTTGLESIKFAGMQVLPTDIENISESIQKLKFKRCSGFNSFNFGDDDFSHMRCLRIEEHKTELNDISFPSSLLSLSLSGTRLRNWVSFPVNLEKLSLPVDYIKLIYKALEKGRDISLPPSLKCLHELIFKSYYVECKEQDIHRKFIEDYSSWIPKSVTSVSLYGYGRDTTSDESEGHSHLKLCFLPNLLFFRARVLDESLVRGLPDSITQIRCSDFHQSTVPHLRDNFKNLQTLKCEHYLHSSQANDNLSSITQLRQLKVGVYSSQNIPKEDLPSSLLSLTLITTVSGLQPQFFKCLVNIPLRRLKIINFPSPNSPKNVQSGGQITGHKSEIHATHQKDTPAHPEEKLLMTSSDQISLQKKNQIAEPPTRLGPSVGSSSSTGSFMSLPPINQGTRFTTETKHGHCVGPFSPTLVKLCLEADWFPSACFINGLPANVTEFVFRS
eukprot:TRINITY_DN8587_c0_g1_i1.p1 TRINITY_DN8587_c0_g1~~TRINITY_DN8587_c0_g1_i1.p1  ORF type:complete len:670 (-),score=41.44 TRINITY_DN8587_c0_g1_i1:44-1996(-)